MKKLIILGLLLLPLSTGCSMPDDEERELFMTMCKIGGNSPQFTEYCECCYSYYKKYGDGKEYMTAIADNCISILR